MKGRMYNFEQCRRMVFTTEVGCEQGRSKEHMIGVRGVHAEFCAGARRAPKQPKVCTSTSYRAEAGPWTERINESTSCRAEAGPRTERINESASCRAEAGPWTEILNVVEPATGLKPDLWTKTINRCIQSRD